MAVARRRILSWAPTLPPKLARMSLLGDDILPVLVGAIEDAMRELEDRGAGEETP